MSSYSSYSDDTDQGHRNWLSDIAEAKHACRELVEMSERVFQNPGVCLDIGLSTSASELLRHQHSAVLNYYEEVDPFKRQLAGPHWTENLCKIDVPKQESTVKLDETIAHNDSIETHISPAVFYQGDQKNESVSLESLDRWGMRTASVTVDAVKQFEGEVKCSVAKRVWLPPLVCRLAYRKLNSCVEDLGFAGEVKEAEVDVEPYQPHQ